jgi:SNF family Na+-dependent transporter
MKLNRKETDVTGIIILGLLVWVAGLVACLTIVYQDGIEEGIRRANKAMEKDEETK